MSKILTMNAQEKEVWLYAAESNTYASGNQGVFKASDLISVSSDHPARTTLNFWSQENDPARTDISSTGIETVVLNHTEDGVIEVMKAIAELISNPHGGFFVLGDDEGGSLASDGLAVTAGAKGYSDLKPGPIASTGTKVEMDTVNSVNTI